MSVAFVDGSTVSEFVEDTSVFKKCVDERFDKLDVDGNGFLTREKLHKRSGKLSSIDFELQSQEEIRNLYEILFDKFDLDKNGMIDRDEFQTLMKEIMLAKARGFGNSPILVIVEGDSMLMHAVKRRSLEK